MTFLKNIMTRSVFSYCASRLMSPSLILPYQVPGWEPEDDDYDEIVERPLAPPPPPPAAPVSRLPPPPPPSSHPPPPPPPPAAPQAPRSPTEQDSHASKPAPAVIAAGMGGLASDVQVGPRSFLASLSAFRPNQPRAACPSPVRPATGTARSRFPGRAEPGRPPRATAHPHGRPAGGAGGQVPVDELAKLKDTKPSIGPAAAGGSATATTEQLKERFVQVRLRGSEAPRSRSEDCGRDSARPTTRDPPPPASPTHPPTHAHTHTDTHIKGGS